MIRDASASPATSQLTSQTVVLAKCRSIPHHETSSRDALSLLSLVHRLRLRIF